MTDFLDENQAQTALRLMLSSADKAELAVAFWGRGAIDLLGLKHEWRHLRVLCNLDSGACNPAEIRELMQLPGRVEVRSSPRLHAKLYRTADTVVVGSSNASSNGLAVDGNQLSGWAEANVHLTEPGIVQTAGGWFNEQFDAAYAINDSHLSKAAALWAHRSKIAPSGLEMKTNLLEAVRNSFDHPAWSSVKVVFYREDVSAEAELERNVELESNSALSDLGYYEGWGETLSSGDWLLDIDLRGGRSNFSGYWSVHNPRLATEHLTFAKQEEAIFLPSFGSLVLAKQDEQPLLRLMRNIGAELTHRVINIADVVHLLDTSEEPKNSASAAALQQAMYKIYDDAAALGYRPTEFRHMLDREGGVVTAKRLINGQRPSSGFVKLWELKRLDLSVEALVLQPQWRNLFSEDEIKRASQRLRQHGGS